jgi:hypothetical protein
LSVEFRNKGVRFALTTPEVMYEGTEHESYDEVAKGQRFELAFPLPSAEEVGKAYDEIVSKGATPIKAPELMPVEYVCQCVWRESEREEERRRVVVGVSWVWVWGLKFNHTYMWY